ncbi:MAG: hypothetical protein GKS05_11290 [Nitrospirales bacterium]|nr:hypothetical protein [Nitrospirales bacterium]
MPELSFITGPFTFPFFPTNAHMSHLPSGPTLSPQSSSLSAKVQLILSTLLFGWAGFFMMDFLLSSVYTWPRVSRALVLVGAAVIHSYEFVYKERRNLALAQGETWNSKIVFYTSALPFMLGSLILLTVASLSSFFK